MIYGDGHCAACKVAIPAGRLLCSDHWRLVPGYLRRLLYVELDRWQTDQITLDVLRRTQNTVLQSIGVAPCSDI